MVNIFIDNKSKKPLVELFAQENLFSRDDNRFSLSQAGPASVVLFILGENECKTWAMVCLSLFPIILI